MSDGDGPLVVGFPIERWNVRDGHLSRIVASKRRAMTCNLRKNKRKT